MQRFQSEPKDVTTNYRQLVQTRWQQLTQDRHQSKIIFFLQIIDNNHVRNKTNSSASTSTTRTERSQPRQASTPCFRIIVSHFILFFEYLNQKWTFILIVAGKHNPEEIFDTDGFTQEKCHRTSYRTKCIILSSDRRYLLLPQNGWFLKTADGYVVWQATSQKLLKVTVFCIDTLALFFANVNQFIHHAVTLC